MHSRYTLHPLPQGAFSIHINGDHDHVSKVNFYF